MKNRHPSRKKLQFSTDTHPIISCGKKEMQLLRYVKSLNNSILNKKQCSRDLGIARTTIIGIVQRLEQKSLIQRSGYQYTLTEIGQSVLLGVEGGVESSLRGCREIENFSMHNIKVEMEITEQSKFNYSRIEKIRPNKVTDMKLNNWLGKYIHYDDVTICIYPQKVIFRVHDLVGDNIEDVELKAVERAIYYAGLIKKIGIIGEGIKLNYAHYARIKSTLSEVLIKRFGRYETTLTDGSKFWIDHSNDEREDETDSGQLRDKLDLFLNDLKDANSFLSDVDSNTKDIEGLKEVAKLMLTREVVRLKEPSIPSNKTIRKPDYVG